MTTKNEMQDPPTPWGLWSSLGMMAVFLVVYVAILLIVGSM